MTINPTVSKKSLPLRTDTLKRFSVYGTLMILFISHILEVIVQDKKK